MRTSYSGLLEPTTDVGGIDWESGINDVDLRRYLPFDGLLHGQTFRLLQRERIEEIVHGYGQWEPRLIQPPFLVGGSCRGTCRY